MKNQYLVSARKYRPDSFATMVGQEALTATLQNAILQDKTAHAYLFCGPRGVGKTTCARVFAKTINCLNRTDGGEACGSCESCVAFEEQRSMNIYELDAASNNSVDDIRQLIEQVALPPQIGRYKIYIIDEVHMLSQGAFNAFLKTLEEPPEYVIFILATTEKHKILPTILSRCQIFDFKRIPVPEIVKHLQYVAQSEAVEAEERALNVIALKADGGMRDALSLFDRMASFGEGKITYEATINNLNILDHEYYFRVIESILQGDYRSVLLTFDQLLNKGFDGQVFINGFASFLRDLLMAQDPSTLSLLEQPESVRSRYGEVAKRCPDTLLIESLQRLNACDQQYRLSNGKRLLVELCLMSICADFMRITRPTPPPAPKQGGSNDTARAQVQASNATQQASNATQQASNVTQQASTRSEQATTLSDSKQQSYQAKEQTAPVAAPVNERPAIQPDVSIVQQAQQALQTSQKQAVAATDYSMLGGGVSLKGLRQRRASAKDTQQENSETASDELPHQAEMKIISNDELQKAWLDYLENELTDEVYIKQFMKQSLPVLADDNKTIQVLLLNMQQQENLEEQKYHLVPYLREKLGNPSLQMELLIDTSERMKLPSTSKEKLDYLLKENPLLEHFIDELGLSY